MDYLILMFLLFLIWAIFIHVFKSKRNSLSLPPGPAAFPIIGNILDLGTNPHHSLTNLSKTLGPVIKVKLGSITAISISSPEFAKEALQKHDQVLSSRTIVDAARAHDHDKFSVLWLPAFDRWRSLRKVMATELFTSRKLEASQDLADFFPLLQIMDPQGIRRQTKVFFDRLLETFDRIITERLELKSSSTLAKDKQDLLDYLLNITQEENNSQLSLVDIKHLLLDLFVGGTDTTSKTVEWAMAELLGNPEKLLKLKQELKEVEGEIQESDIHRLPYLQATIKEVYRLHPPAPFLVPRKAESEVEIGGFKIPKDAKILVNVWAIGRDGSIWENPDKFEPERFLESKIDVKGRDFELLPFGAGRRVCPGLPLAYRMLHLMLASLVHSFDWKLAHDIQPNELDMTETFGLSLYKAKPLLVVPCL